MSDIANWILNTIRELFAIADRYNPLRIIFHDSELQLSIVHASCLGIFCLLTAYIYQNTRAYHPGDKQGRRAARNAFSTSFFYLGGVNVAFVIAECLDNSFVAAFCVVVHAVSGLLYSSYYSPVINDESALKSQSITELISRALQMALMLTYATQLLDNLYPQASFVTYNKGFWLADLALIIGITIAGSIAMWQIRKRNRTIWKSLTADPPAVAPELSFDQQLRDRRVSAYGSFNLKA
jgi:hypothetical protein